MHIVDVLPRDAIPSIDDPTFGSEYFGADADRVLVLDADPPRVYPVGILGGHEIVNDRVAGLGGEDGERPVAVTWCPICGSGAVYDRRVDGRTLTFGVSGKLADDALVMYDRETGTEWRQSSGDAIAGALAGRRLDLLTAPLSTWERFRDEHPDGVVLQPVRGGGTGGEDPAEVYDPSRYDGYVESEHFGLYGMRGAGDPREWDRTDLDPKTVVLGVERDGAAVGYPRPRVADAGGVVTDDVADQSIVVVLADGELHAYADPGYAVEPAGEETIRADGTTWDGATGASKNGRHLDRVPTRRLYAFAWQDVHGPDAFWSA